MQAWPKKTCHSGTTIPGRLREKNVEWDAETRCEIWRKYSIGSPVNHKPLIMNGLWRKFGAARSGYNGADGGYNRVDDGYNRARSGYNGAYSRYNRADSGYNRARCGYNGSDGGCNRTVAGYKPAVGRFNRGGGGYNCGGAGAILNWSGLGGRLRRMNALPLKTGCAPNSAPSHFQKRPRHSTIIAVLFSSSSARA